jgi:hypothetical protein
MRGATQAQQGMTLGIALMCEDMITFHFLSVRSPAYAGKKLRRVFFYSFGIQRFQI